MAATCNSIILWGVIIYIVIILATTLSGNSNRPTRSRIRHIRLFEHEIPDEVFVGILIVFLAIFVWMLFKL